MSLEGSKEKKLQRMLVHTMQDLIFEQELCFKNEFLRMEHFKFDSLAKGVLKIMNTLERFQLNLILKGSFDVEAAIMSFMVKVACQMIQYTPYLANTSQPDFSFQEFIREVNGKIEEVVLRKKGNLVLVVQVEDYNHAHLLNDPSRQSQIIRLLFFLQAIS
mmetsp:Transcript_9211/g.8614  ORF Transcript_9211/g.8614 Transcript_9211/m.8614 type:complete len:161 (+) Transcript_9211:2678-3160(+)